MKTSLSQRLRQWQASLQLSDPQAAATLGVPVRTYENWKQGHRAPRGLALNVVLRIITPTAKG